MLVVKGLHTRPGIKVFATVTKCTTCQVYLLIDGKDSDVRINKRLVKKLKTKTKQPTNRAQAEPMSEEEAKLKEAKLNDMMEELKNLEAEILS